MLLKKQGQNIKNNRVEKKITNTKKFYQKTAFWCNLDLKKQVETNNFSHLVAEARFHIRYFSEYKKYAALLLANFYYTKKFLTCKYNQDDTLWISLFLIQM